MKPDTRNSNENFNKRHNDSILMKDLVETINKDNFGEKIELNYFT